MYVLGGERGFLHHRGAPPFHHSENNSCQNNINTITFLNGTFIGGVCAGSVPGSKRVQTDQFDNRLRRSGYQAALTT
jgi:hypothetical protein